MLSSMRKLGGSFVSKALMMFLVISFAIWGVGDVLRAASGPSDVANVNGERITITQFGREMSRLRRAMENANLPKVDNGTLATQLLRQMVIERLTGFAFHDLGLSISDHVIAAKLRAAPMFKNTDGTFNGELFRNMLRQRGMSEEGFLAQLKSDMRSHTLMDSLDTSDISLPPPLLAMQAQSAGETRDAVVVTLPISAANPKAPSEKDMKDYYDRHKDVLYVQPETRTLEYATFGTSDIAALVDKRINDAALKEKFEAEKSRFATPEQRHVLQLLTADTKDADKAKAAMKPGATINDLHKAALNAKQTDLGLVARDKLPATAGDAIFFAKNGEVVGPIDTDFGQAFYQVTSIQPAGNADFDKVKPMLTAELRDEARDKTMEELSNQVEDTLAAGKSMHDALAAAGIESAPHELKSITQESAKDKDPLVAAVATQGFTLGEGETSSLNVVKNGTYYMVHVKAVKAATPKPFDEVRADVEKRLRLNAAMDAVSERAGNLMADLKKNKDWQSVLNAQHVSGRTVSGITRSGASGIPTPLATAVFQHEPGATAGPYTMPTGDVMLAIITGVHHNPAAKLSDAERKELSDGLKDEVLQQYYASLTKRYPVDVNEKSIAAVTKGGEDE